MTILKRRRIFVGLVGAFGSTFFLGLLPGLHGMLWLSLAIAASLAAYITFLVEEKKRHPVHRRLNPQPLPTERRTDDVPAVLKLAYTPPTPLKRNGVRPVHRIVDESLEEDDGLGELAWARAGRY